jgi:2-polyprenyl-3-methyl-5-hydroxy-6-metoxy-1,4-benzoquinol methylase
VDNPNVACVICGSDAPFAGEKNSYRYYRCNQCRHLFVWPMPDNHLEIYLQDYFQGAQDGGFGYVDYDRDKLPMVPTFEFYLDLLERAGAKGGAMLDIGAATGFFLDIARRRGWKPYGVEASGYAAGIARSKGLDVTTGVLEECSFDADSFDVITAWDVIEHLNSPRNTTQKMNHLLKRGGLLAINTPDAGSALAGFLGTKWHLVAPPEHLNLFHRKSLRRLLEENGFEIVMEDRIGKTFTVQYVFQTLFHWQKLKIWEAAANGLQHRSVGRWGIPINLRDNMFLIARKTRGLPVAG